MLIRPGRAATRRTVPVALLLALAACGEGTPTGVTPQRLPVVAGAQRCLPLTTDVRPGPAQLDVQNDGADPVRLVLTRAEDGAELGSAEVPGTETVRLPVELGAGTSLLSCSRGGQALGAPVRLSPAD